MKLPRINSSLIRRLFGSYLLDPETPDPDLAAKAAEVRARFMLTVAQKPRDSRWTRWKSWWRRHWKLWRKQFTLPWVIEMLIIFAGVTATLLVGYFQLKSVNDGLSSSTAAAVYQQQQEIDDIFVEHPEMNPYFSDEVPVPPPPVLSPIATEPEREIYEEAVQKKAKIEAVAFRILDHFEHIRYQVENGLFEISYASWDEYIRTSFSSSPVLCEMLLKNNEEYDGTRDGSLWEEFAATPCAEVGIRP